VPRPTGAQFGRVGRRRALGVQQVDGLRGAGLVDLELQLGHAVFVVRIAPRTQDFQLLGQQPEDAAGDQAQ
jgi:hypothetical protein